MFKSFKKTFQQAFVVKASKSFATKKQMRFTQLVTLILFQRDRISGKFNKHHVLTNVTGMICTLMTEPHNTF